MNSQSNSTLKKAARRFSVSLALRLGRLVLNILLISQIARYLGQEGLGHLTVAMSVVLVLMCITELGMQTIVVRELVDAGSFQWVALGSAAVVRLGAGVFAYGVLALYAWVARPDHIEVFFIYGTILIFSVGTVLMAWLVAKQNTEAVSWAQMAGFLASGAVIIYGIVFKAELWVFALAFVVECLVAICIAAVMFKYAGGQFKHWGWSSNYAKKVTKESWYELATQLALLLLLRVDALMIEAINGPAEAGVYGAAVRVAEAVYFIPALLASVCFPPLVVLRERDPSRYQRRFREYFSLTILIAVPSAIFLAFVAPYVVDIVFGKDFSASAPILAVHAWALIPYAIGITRNSYLTAESKLWLNLPCVVLALVTNVTLNFWWIPAFGGVGAAWATLIAYTVGWVLSAFIVPPLRGLASMILGGFLTIPSLLGQWRYIKLSHRSE